MGTLFSQRKSNRIPLLQVTYAIRGSEAGPSREDDHQLLVGEMEVVGIGGLSRRDLPDARAD